MENNKNEKCGKECLKSVCSEDDNAFVDAGTYVDDNAVLGKNVQVDGGVRIVGNCVIEDGCHIGFGSHIINCKLGAGCEVENSKLEKSEFGQNCLIGPYANVRAGCKVADRVKVGAFVELKNCTIGSGTKVAHLSYVGDAELGENVNIGCGVVFANYDGKNKHRSKIGNDVFVGCNVNIVAPVLVADKTYICAGTTVTQNTEVGDFVIGRVRQENRKRKNPKSE